MVGARLLLRDGTLVEAQSFGAIVPTAGEVVFATGMMGYPESLTDPSYTGQILVLTYPLIGNYGVPEQLLWESDRIMVSGLIVSQYIDTPSHFQSNQSLSQWFKKEKIPLLEIKDTRFLTQYLREKGAMLGKIIFDSDIPYYNPNSDNLVDKVSTKKISYHKGLPTKQHKSMTVLLIDCGAKRHIRQALLERGVNVITCPWDFNPFTTTPLLNSLPQPQSGQFSPFDAIVISNGPGDPTMVDKTIQTVRQALTKGIPTLGICLGHQILSLAAGGETKKLQYGHRSQNQPCVMNGSPRCYITTQNHGFAVSTLPTGFKAWFTNANDNTNEGIIHEKLPFMSVQFHPEATPGPTDTEWIFDYFLHSIRNTKV